jgi:proteasome lid subunit RPN8/RPN11
MKITEAAFESVKAHVVEGFPEEICGMLVAKRGTRKVVGVRRATNALADRRVDRYQIDPKEHRAIEDECDAAALDIVGYYHSHPQHKSYASRLDTRDAWPNLYYLIVSCIDKVVQESRVFQKADWDAIDMIEEDLQVVSR